MGPSSLAARSSSFDVSTFFQLEYIMANKSKALIAAEAEIATLKTKLADAARTNDALQARITLATEVYRNQRARINELEAALAQSAMALQDNCEQAQANAAQRAYHLAARPAAAKPAAPVITRFVRRDGVTCERVRYGNRSIVREVVSCSVPGIEVEYVNG
jgi:tryptophan 2,3-dioxygenase